MALEDFVNSNSKNHKDKDSCSFHEDRCLVLLKNQVNVLQLWRLDDLYDRLDFLTEAGASYNSRTRLSDDDIRYAVPNYFEHIADVENAIELAMSELNFKKIIWQLPLPKEQLEIGYKKYECKGVQ